MIIILFIFLAIEATCKDGITNQGEIGTDCGGPCPPCGKISWNYQVPQNRGTLIMLKSLFLRENIFSSQVV